MSLFPAVKNPFLPNILLTFCPDCGHVYNSVFDPRLIEYTAAYENSLHHSGVFQGYVEGLVHSLNEQYALKGKLCR